MDVDDMFFEMEFIIVSDSDVLNEMENIGVQCRVYCRFCNMKWEKME